METIDKQVFIKEMNKRSKYFIVSGELEKYIKTAEKESVLLHEKIVGLCGINPINKMAMQSYLNTIRFNSENNNKLMIDFEESASETLALMVDEYNHITWKLKKFILFKDGLKKENSEISISPTFSLNKNGAITLAKPTLQFKKNEIQKLLGFNCVLQCNSLDAIIDFLIEYKNIVMTTSNRSSFLVAGTTLYFNLNIDLISSFTIFDHSYEEWFTDYMNQMFSKHASNMMISLHLLQEIKSYVGINNWEIIKRNNILW